MKKLVAVAVIAGLLSVLGAQAASAQLLNVSAGDLTAGVFPEDELTTLSGSGYPFAVGGGMTSDGTKFAFSARNGPNGPSGYAVFKNAFFEAQGHVICYTGNIPGPGGDGRVAGFYIEVDKASGLVVRPLISVVVLDSGASGGSGDLLRASNSGACETLFVTLGGGPVVQGNIVVKN